MVKTRKTRRKLTFVELYALRQADAAVDRAVQQLNTIKQKCGLVLGQDYKIAEDGTVTELGDGEA